jgi:hypothetical protein
MIQTKRNFRLNYNIAQMDLTDSYRIFHSIAAEYTFFSAAHGTFSKIDCFLGHKTSLGKFKTTEIISCVLSHHSGRKLEVNSKRN